MSWRYDPELDEVFTDPDQRRLAAILTAVQAPVVEPDPAFRSQLRRQLMAEAWGRAEPKMPWWRRLTAPAPAAWGMATVGLLLIASAVFYAIHPGGGANTVLVTFGVDPTRPVAAVQPLDVRFTQPMDRASVEQALQINPSTTVDYQWVSDQEVKITPVAGSFAPNTQYTVSLLPNVAKSQNGAAVTQTAPAVFTVKPTPTPTPTPSATPTPNPITVQKLAPLAPTRVVWLSGTAALVVTDSGQLDEVIAGASEPTVVLVPNGVKAVAARPDGQAALALSAAGASEVTLNGAVAAPVAGSAGALAAGYDGSGKPWFVTPTLAIGAGHQYKLAETATAAWLAPKADALVYQSGQDIRFVDLASDREAAWPAPAAGTGQPVFLAWSPDGKAVLYSNGSGLVTAAPDGTTPRQIASDAGVVTADWSAGGSVVYATAGSSYVVSSDGQGHLKLADGKVEAMAWQPGANAYAYGGGGALWLATLTSPPPASATVPSVEEATKAVTTFMDARVAGQSATAQGLLATAARTAYPGSTLIPAADPKLSRWFPVASLAGSQSVRFDVRLVFAAKDGRDVSQLDEVLTVVRDAGSKAVVIGSAQAGASRPYGQGPEVINVITDSDGKVRVQFDSDLQAAGATAAVIRVDAAGKPLATAAMNGTREVVLTPNPGTAPGTGTLKVLTSLKNKDGRAASAEFDLALGA